VLRERVERPFAGEGKRRSALLQTVVLGRVVGDVLADPFLTATVEMHDGRLAQELGAGLKLQAFERVPVDAERKVVSEVNTSDEIVTIPVPPGQDGQPWSLSPRAHNQLWFFKLTGPQATVSSKREAFLGLIRSVK